MNNWFECKVKYVKVDDTSGKEKKVTETFLVDAMTFTEAEARTITELEQMISGEFLITDISRSNITETYPNDDGDRWFKAKVTFMDVDEASGNERLTNNYMLVEANTVDHAYSCLEEKLMDVLIPYKIPAVSESPIVEIFPYFKDE